MFFPKRYPDNFLSHLVKVVNKLTVKIEGNTNCLEIIFYIIVITALIFGIPVRFILACYLLDKSNIYKYYDYKIRNLESYHFRKANPGKITLSS